MKRMWIVLCLAVLALPLSAKETGPIAEVFACKLNPEKTIADFDAATKHWQQVVATIPAYDDHLAAVFVPYRARSEYDALWFGYYDNINSFARADVAYMTNGGAEAEALFAAAARCDGGLFAANELFDALPNEPNDDDALAEVFACKLREGKTMTDFEAANTAQVAAVKALKAADSKFGNLRLRQLTPWYADTPYDLYSMVINDDVESFARDLTTWVNSKEGAETDAAYASAADCEGGLWRAHRVHTPKPRKN